MPSIAAVGATGPGAPCTMAQPWLISPVLTLHQPGLKTWLILQQMPCSGGVVGHWLEASAYHQMVPLVSLTSVLFMMGAALRALVYPSVLGTRNLNLSLFICGMGHDREPESFIGRYRVEVSQAEIPEASTGRKGEVPGTSGGTSGNEEAAGKFFRPHCTPSQEVKDFHSGQPPPGLAAHGIWCRLETEVLKCTKFSQSSTLPTAMTH